MVKKTRGCGHRWGQRGFAACGFALAWLAIATLAALAAIAVTRTAFARSAFASSVLFQRSFNALHRFDRMALGVCRRMGCLGDCRVKQGLLLAFGCSRLVAWTPFIARAALAPAFATLTAFATLAALAVTAFAIALAATFIARGSCFNRGFSTRSRVDTQLVDLRRLAACCTALAAFAATAFTPAFATTAALIAGWALAALGAFAFATGFAACFGALAIAFAAAATATTASALAAAFATYAAFAIALATPAAAITATFARARAVALAFAGFVFSEIGRAHV